eukprot:1706651-Amphidinium_carterae.1
MPALWPSVRMSSVSPQQRRRQMQPAAVVSNPGPPRARPSCYPAVESPCPALVAPQPDHKEGRPWRCMWPRPPNAYDPATLAGPLLLIALPFAPGLNGRAVSST